MSSSSEETVPYAPLPLPVGRSHPPRGTGAPLEPSGSRDPFAKATNFRPGSFPRPPTTRGTGAPLEPSGSRDPFAKATNFRPRTIRRPAPAAAPHQAPPARACPPPPGTRQHQAPPARARTPPRAPEPLSDSDEELPPIPPGHPFRQPPRRIRGVPNHAER